MSTILIVEDDATSREMLVHRLVNCGFQVLQASNGADAKEMVLCCLPDLVLLDITLPDMNGLDILKHLKSNSKTSNIPVLIVSGRDSSEDVIQGLNLGACDYITKPYQWGVINARIKSALRSIDMARLLKEALYQEKVNVQTKSDFLINMSHEIRTPLNGILGLLQLIKQTPLSTEQTEYIKLMDRSGESLLHVINGLLDISKIESGHFELDNRPFNLEELVKGVSEIIYPKACQKNLEIFIKTTPGTNLNIIGDPTRISQIVTNYASNAIKFTEKGCITFHVRANQGTTQSAVYHIEIEDTGIGLSTEAQKKLFNKFIQADPSIVSEYGGTGLGLSICKEIAEALGGHVGMHSIEGKGTRFWLEVPLKFDPDQLEPEEIDLSNKSILIVGSSYFCSNYGELTSKWGAQVNTVEKLPKATPKKGDFDLIITSDISVLDAVDTEQLPTIMIHEGLLKTITKEQVTHLREPLKPSDLLKLIRILLKV